MNETFSDLLGLGTFFPANQNRPQPRAIGQGKAGAS